MPSPRFEQHPSHVAAIVAAIRQGSDPRACTAAAVVRSPPRSKRPAVIAVGKAAPAMLAGFLESTSAPHDAVVVVPQGVEAPPGAIVADHPLPTRRSLRAAERVADFVGASVSGAAGHDGFVVLLSGGASSLLTWPAKGIELQDYADSMEELLRSGIDIQTLNTIRKHCEQLKGGRLAAMMGGLPCDTYVLSDVIGDELSNVGSGPTLPDPTTFADALRPFEWKLELTQAATVLLPRLRAGLRGVHPETPKPGDPSLSAARAILVGSSALAVDAAAAAAADLGFGQAIVRTGVVGAAADAGRSLAAAVLSAPAPSAVVWGGETTVDVGMKAGKGGRNQELALAAAIAIDGQDGIVIATFATDGVDGPTDAAGAVVTGRTCSQARAAGLDPYEQLENHNSFSVLDRVGALIRTGPTGTNVNDVAVALRYRQPVAPSAGMLK